MSLHIVVVTAFSVYYLIYASVVVANSSIDPYKALNITLNPDGTITRLSTPPESPPNPVLSKDLTINRSKHTWARIYLHHKALDYSPNDKRPLIVYYHGGGFILASAATTTFHDFCVNMVNQTQFVVVSVDYRLAPEHRLPAAYEDSLEALHWIKASNDPWLLRHADYSHCYLMGDSAGGNIAYNAGLRAAAEVDRIKPLKIQGLVLIQPFFGGTKRTQSELRLAEDTVLPLSSADLLWNLSLPIGVDRDYEYSNPTVKGGTKVLDQIKVLGWRVAVFGCEGVIFVGGLPAGISEEEFKKYFERFGRITDVVVMQDSVTHRPRGFGFITFDSEESVQNVMVKSFHDLNGRQVEVKRAVPKEGNHGYDGFSKLRNKSERGVPKSFPPYSPRNMLPGFAPLPWYSGDGVYAYGSNVYGCWYPVGGYGGNGYAVPSDAPRNFWYGPVMTGPQACQVPYASAVPNVAYVGGRIGIVGSGAGSWGYSGILGSATNLKFDQAFNANGFVPGNVTSPHGVKQDVVDSSSLKGSNGEISS